MQYGAQEIMLFLTDITVEDMIISDDRYITTSPVATMSMVMLIDTTTGRNTEAADTAAALVTITIETVGHRQIRTEIITLRITEITIASMTEIIMPIIIVVLTTEITMITATGIIILVPVIAVIVIAIPATGITMITALIATGIINPQILHVMKVQLLTEIEMTFKQHQGKTQAPLLVILLHQAVTEKVA